MVEVEKRNKITIESYLRTKKEGNVYPLFLIRFSWGQVYSRFERLGFSFTDCYVILRLLLYVLDYILLQMAIELCVRRAFHIEIAVSHLQEIISISDDIYCIALPLSYLSKSIRQESNLLTYPQGFVCCKSSFGFTFYSGDTCA